MEEKTFQLLEKMYAEFIGFKEEMTGFKKEMISFKKEVNDRFNKIEVNQEEIIDKVSEAFEAIDTLVQTNNKQHEEIMKELKGDISIVELAVKRIAK